MRTSDHAAFEDRFATDGAVVAQARDQFHRWLDSSFDDPELVEEMTVVFAELASNAASAVATPDDPIVVRAWCEADELVLTVTNTVTVVEEVTRWDMTDPLRGGGRGLMIVRAFTDDLDVEADDRSLTVRCRRQISAA